MLRADGALIAHLVTSRSPLRTESFIGTPDAPGLEVLGRAIAVRRGTSVVPLGAPARPALLGLQKAWALAARTRLLRGVYSLAAAVVGSEVTARARLLLAPIELHLLGAEDLADVAVALSRWVTLGGDALETLVRDGVAIGARNGRASTVSRRDRQSWLVKSQSGRQAGCGGETQA